MASSPEKRKRVAKNRTLFTKRKLKIILSNVDSLFHSNSLLNAISFIKRKALLSRSFCFINKIPITPQYSDYYDIKFNLLDSIFLETSLRPERSRSYGPIIFEFNKEILETKSLFLRARFLRSNPEIWDSKSIIKISERYFAAKELDLCDSEACLVIERTSGVLPFEKNLKAIYILDSCKKRSSAKYRKKKIEDVCWIDGNRKTKYSSAAKTSIESALQEVGLIDVKLEIIENLWKTMHRNWMSMMYFPGKLHSYRTEIDLIYNKRKANPKIRENDPDIILAKLHKIYSDVYE
jgi:hypothetical protein